MEKIDSKLLYNDFKIYDQFFGLSDVVDDGSFCKIGVCVNNSNGLKWIYLVVDSDVPWSNKINGNIVPRSHGGLSWW